MTIVINEHTYELGERVGNGGFGEVYKSLKDNQPVAIKLIPKAAGAARDLLFVNLSDAENVIPVLESGDTESDWVIVMPLADYSLRSYLNDSGPSEELTIKLLSDIVDSLVSLGSSVVHRDIKPENILFYDGRWCLSDFGISRYAEATTAPDTQKYSLSTPYAAPERWRNERANNKTDVYSLGIVAYETATGARPFSGPETEDFRHQHIETRPERPNLSSSLLADLIEEMLYKSTDSRPTPANINRRINDIQSPPVIRIESLEAANTSEIDRQSNIQTERQLAMENMDRRSRIQSDALASFERISNSLRTAIASAAPSANFANGSSARSWFVSLNKAKLEIPPMNYINILDWGGWPEPPKFDVIATAEIILKNLDEGNNRREGRAHSLWYCDAKEEGEYDWYETGFMISPLIARSTVIEPFSLDPGEDAAKALWQGMAEVQVAWPFTHLDSGGTNDFVVRWGNWFGLAAQNGYQPPSQMPEYPTNGTWRTS